MSSASPVFAGIEAGGTKFVCGVGSGPDDLRDDPVSDHYTGGTTIGRCIAFLRESARTPTRCDRHRFLRARGPSPDSPHGAISRQLRKPGWREYGSCRAAARGVRRSRSAFDTDVNAAALAEHRWGAARDVNDCVYLTVGTGIGGGVICGGGSSMACSHPEMGHMRIPHDSRGGSVSGELPVSRRLPRRARLAARRLAAMSSGRAAARSTPRYRNLARYDIAGPDHSGGGVMEQRHLFDLIHQHTLALLNGYLESERITAEIDRYIVPPGLRQSGGSAWRACAGGSSAGRGAGRRDLDPPCASCDSELISPKRGRRPSCRPRSASKPSSPKWRSPRSCRSCRRTRKPFGRRAE